MQSSAPRREQHRDPRSSLPLNPPGIQRSMLQAHQQPPSPLPNYWTPTGAPEQARRPRPRPPDAPCHQCGVSYTAKRKLRTMLFGQCQIQLSGRQLVQHRRPPPPSESRERHRTVPYSLSRPQYHSWWALGASRAPPHTCERAHKPQTECRENKYTSFYSRLDARGF